MFGIFLWVCKPILKGEKLLYLYIRLHYIHCLMSNWIPFVGFLSLLIRLAMSAIEAKNHSVLNGKVIRVMWSLRDPDARRSGKGNVFVKVSALY